MDLDHIKASEGLRLTAYKDSLGFWTVGWGHLLPSGRDWTGYTITLDEAIALLDTDVAVARRSATSLPEAAGLSDGRLDALTELVFNMGPSKWKLFAKTRAAISDQAWQKAHDELLTSRWADQVGFARSTRLANSLLLGIY